MGVPESVGDPRLTNRVTAASRVMMPVTTQPRMWSVGPKSATGTNGTGLTTGTTRSGTALSTFTEASLGGADIGVDRRLSVMSYGRLLLGATPLGQPSDASARLIKALGDAEVVAAEDTRRVRTLAKTLGVAITGRVVSMFDQIEAARVPALVDEIKAGATVLVVSDAGMPLISDPGYRMVGGCVEAGIPVTCLPGPSAVTTALAVSGLPSERFCFEGFAPRKQGARRSWLASLAAEQRTAVFFESPRRLHACLLDAVDQLGGDRRAGVCRELTK